MKSTIEAADVQLRSDVVQELEWDPEFDASQVAVMVEGGAVTLTGFVDTYVAKLAAERAAKRVFGVRAVANDLQVKARFDRTDPEIAKEAVHALQSFLSVPERVKVSVREGIVTLDGTVDSLFQKVGAERAVRYLRGMRGLKNYIAVETDVSPKDVQSSIEKALQRNAEVDARRIHVETHGTTVSLHGTVHSWAEKTAAERAAWAARGVRNLESHLVIAP